MASVREWQAQLLEIADVLEAGALSFALAREARDELQDFGDRAGALRMDAPWAALPHAEVVLDEIVPQVRKIARMLDDVQEPPSEESDA